MSKYQYTEDMREISGFGGGYEEACRRMVIAGMEWFDANPNANPLFQGFKNVTGLVMDDNEDAEALSRVVAGAAGGDCTGAMHHAAINHILYARKHGWEAYQLEMRKSSN